MTRGVMSQMIRKNLVHTDDDSQNTWLCQCRSQNLWKSIGTWPYSGFPFRKNFSRKILFWLSRKKYFSKLRSKFLQGQYDGIDTRRGGESVERGYLWFLTFCDDKLTIICMNPSVALAPENVFEVPLHFCRKFSLMFSIYQFTEMQEL